MPEDEPVSATGRSWRTAKLDTALKFYALQMQNSSLLAPEVNRRTVNAELLEI